MNFNCCGVKMKTKIFALYFFLLFLPFGCDNNPLINKNEKKIELEIISANQILINWDSTIYQHNTDWNSYLNSTAYDSLANLLKNSEILIEDMWCPNEVTDCLILLKAGSDIIIKLNKPDTLIYSYGFQNNDGVFPIGCFGLWRHYKYIHE